MKTTTFFAKSFLLRVSALILLSSAVLHLDAQITVSGKLISASDGLGLTGATVLIKGTGDGTVTDIDGSYKLSVPSTETVLVFSYTGMTTQEVLVGDQTVINLEMQSDILSLSEVVVTGYGVQKKENLSGAVDNVTTEQLTSRPIANLAQGLQGVSPNLNIDFDSGEPGAAARINIRGFTSVNGGSPLILIDGVPSDAIELNRLAPRDVESISVLKDASSAAIYGARAAFGVIIITTKSGAGEGVHVSYSNNFNISEPTVIGDKITDPYIYLRLKETSTDNTPWDNFNFSDERYEWARQRSDDPSVEGVRLDPNDPSRYEYMGNRDWTDYFLTSSKSQEHHLSVSGRSKTAQYFVSGSYNNTNGALDIADDYFDRYTLRGKVNFNVTDRLSLGTNIYVTSTDRTTPSYFDIFTLLNFEPTDYAENPDGTWANTPVGREAAQLRNGGMTNDQYNSYQTNFTAKLDIIKNVFSVNADFTTRRGHTDYRRDFRKYNIGFGPDQLQEEGTNIASRSSTNDLYNVFNVYGSFQQLFGSNHQITAIAGFNQEYFRTEWFNAYRPGVISASLPTIALATGDATVNEYIADWAVRGAFYRLNYTFADKYIVEFNGRYDGSSRFPKEKRFGFFPSASVAWRLDKEAFISADAISMLKIRASYGSLGNQSVSEYGYIPSLNAVTGNYIIDGKLPQRIIAPPLVSANYSWEDVSTLNAGLDLGLFEGQLTLNFDIYQRDTKGMLTLGKDLPDVLGASEPAENAADLSTKGWEFGVTFQNRFQLAGKPLHFDTRIVISDSRTTITKFDNPNGNLNQYYEGMDLGEIWGLTSDGLFGSTEEISTLDETALIPWGALSIVPGWPKYIDQDGNGLIEKGLTTEDPKDLSIIGNLMPRYRFGINLGADWSGLDVSLFLQGIGKRDYYPQDYLYWGFYQQPYAGGYAHLTDFYRPNDDSQVQQAKHSQAYLDAGLANANTDAKYPILQAWLADRNLGERVDESRGLAIPQSGYLLNGAYLRVKNLTIGYQIPQRLLDRVNIEKLRFFVSGDNLFEFSGVKDFYDPEAITSVDDKLNPTSSTGRGTGSGFAYPFQRRYSIGLNLDF
jgi:TonB-linked SusC/RagA family outer membrane protein